MTAVRKACRRRSVSTPRRGGEGRVLLPPSGDRGPRGVTQPLSPSSPAQEDNDSADGLRLLLSCDDRGQAHTQRQKSSRQNPEGPSPSPPVGDIGWCVGTDGVRRTYPTSLLLHFIGRPVEVTLTFVTVGLKPLLQLISGCFTEA